MFVNEQDGMDIVEVNKKDSYGYPGPRRELEGKAGPMGGSVSPDAMNADVVNSRTFYNP